MNWTTKFLISLVAIMVIGMLTIPVLTFAACGGRPDCAECLTQETCEAEFLCTWDVDCQDQTISEIGAADITTAVGHVSGLFSDAKLLILLIIGLPLGFYIITRAIGIVPGVAKTGRRGRKI